MIVDCVSDLHGFYPELSGGDLLIVAGDLTASNRKEQYEQFFKWLSDQPYKKIVVISGNHDGLEMSQFDWGEKVSYLYDSREGLDGFEIWGSPWTSLFKGVNPSCSHFMLDGEPLLAQKWALIPDDVDILVTHSPPKGILDRTQRKHRVGSSSLYDAVKRIRPKLHVFGHIHEGYGQIVIDGTRFVNASHVDENYVPSNNSVRVVL